MASVTVREALGRGMNEIRNAARATRAAMLKDDSEKTIEQLHRIQANTVAMIILLAGTENAVVDAEEVVRVGDMLIGRIER